MPVALPIMPESQNKKGKKNAIIRQQPTPPTQDELSDGYGVLEDGGPMEKDETELELEKLVFGDDAGFREGLKLYRNDTVDTSDERSGEDVAAGSAEDAEVGDLNAVDDVDVSQALQYSSMGEAFAMVILTVY